MGEIKFGTGGFRGVIGDDFTKENVQKICQAMSNIAEKKNYKKKICIGYDNRFMSEDYATWCSEVFAGNGFDVELFQNATSTPVAMYATKKEENDYGVMITASHNPYMYNGIKVFVREGRDAGARDTELIESELKNVRTVNLVDFKSQLGGKIKYVNLVEEFVDSIITNQNIPNCKGLKVVFDAMYGSTVEELKLFSQKVGLQDFEIINCTRDALFGFVTPAPNVNNIEKLKMSVLSSGADIGFALDADGDRLAIVDSDGNYIDNNYILALVYYYLVKYNGKKGGSVKNVATSNLLNVVTKKLGYQCYEVPVGFKYVSGKLSETGSVVGGESSGGLAVSNHIWGKDSLLAIAFVLKIMADLKKPFKTILKELLEFAGGYSKIIKDKQYSYTKEQEKEIKDKLFVQKALPKHRYEVESVYFGDYVKIYYTNGNWVLIRFSGTEPVFRTFVEADTEAECDNLIHDWEVLLGL